MGVSPVTIAALAGNSPEVVWRHYAREFERSRTAAPMPLAERLRMARGAVATAAAELAGVERW